MNKIQYEKLLKPLIKIYDEIELDLIKNIILRIENYNDVKGSLKWYLDKLNEIGILDRESTNILKNNKNKIAKALIKIMKDAGHNIDNLDLLNSYYKKGLLNVNPIEIYNSTAINNIINNALKDRNSIMNLINTKAIEGTKRAYKDILNKAYVETASGVYTYTESIRRALKEYAKSGIQTVHYESGKSLSIESVVRRDVITRTNKLVGDVELQHAKDLETNLVYVDQHLGARVRTKYMKHDYEAHAEWQGKKYMIEGSSDKYKNLYETTGYGEMLGLKGINCYHNMRPTWEWEKIPNLIDEVENADKYKLLQEQRAYERKIRRLKREQLVAKETFDNEELSKVNTKLKNTNKEFNEWLKDSQLNRDYNREYVTPIKSAKIVPDSIKEKLKSININAHNSLAAMDKDLLDKNVEQITKLTKKYNMEEFFDTMDATYMCVKRNSVASVGYDEDMTYIYINSSSNSFKTKELYNEVMDYSKNTGWCMPCKKDKEDIYIMTHEFGHTLEMKIFKDKYPFGGKIEYKLFCDKTKDDIINIAKRNNPKFDSSKIISKYGDKKTSDFFAEIFASMEVGYSNELAKAMKIYLNERGIL